MNRPIVNERGERLLRMTAVDAAVTADFALVVAVRADEALLVHNRMSAVWELPGGFLDPGETPDACARREVLEESGQHIATVIGVADILIELPDGAQRRGRGRVFRGMLTRWSPFVPNAEVDACRTWATHALPASTSAIDAHLLRRLT